MWLAPKECSFEIKKLIVMKASFKLLMNILDKKGRESGLYSERSLQHG